ncbi:MAG: hypothetical protein IKC40_02615 [Oscillospiraceae bacterium]|nr:hypothetical protein [Oscillospiraceae bacterium]
MAMEIPSGVLKTTLKPGGLEKDSVMTYLDELNSKITELEDELKKRDEEPDPGESELIKEYRRDLEAAERKASEAEKRASQSDAKLQDAMDKASQLAAALTAEKEARNADAQKLKQALEQVKSNGIDEGKVREYQQEIVSLKAEIGQLTSENDSLKASAASNDQQMNSTVEKLNAEIEAKNAAVAEVEKNLDDVKAQLSGKDGEIDELKKKVTELEAKASQSTGFAPSFDMSAIFAQAQQNAIQLEMQAKAQAEKAVADANAQAEKTVSDANAQAEKTVADANAQAEKTVADANAQAETTVTEANAKAEKTVGDADAYAEKKIADANAEADRIVKTAEERTATANATADEILNTATEKAQKESDRIKKDAKEQQERVKQLTATIKSMLTIEIDGIEKSFREAGELMSRAASMMDEKIKAAGAVVADARDCVETNTKIEEETMEDIMNNTASSKFVNASGNVSTEYKSGVKLEKKPGDFSFDMSELIKDAEASVSE